MKKTPKILCFALAIAVCALFPFALTSLPHFDNTNTPAGYKGILELWHIESFEGGVNSRAEWLRKRAIEFEKSNKGLYINVSALTVLQMSQRLEQGESFHLISFGVGVGNMIMSLLDSYSGSINVRDDLLKYGQLLGKQMAVPYMMGGYCLFARQADINKVNGFSSLLTNAFNSGITKTIGKHSYVLPSINFGLADYNLPLFSLAVSNQVMPPQNLTIEKCTQYAAYESFLGGIKSTILLGTQRDHYRLSAKESNNTIAPLSMYALSGFTDLIQYLAIAKNLEAPLQAFAQKYIEFVCLDKSQAKLTSLHMYSVNGQKIYTDNIQEAALLTDLKSLNVFLSEEILAELANKCNQWLAGGLQRNDLLKALN